MPTKELSFYLKKVNLKGFKSIESLTVELENGLNILIGKNLSGKSNFLEGLYSIMVENGNYISSKLEFLFSYKDVYRVILEFLGIKRSFFVFFKTVDAKRLPNKTDRAATEIFFCH
jgi:AAA15 family ATPase/GTPase